MTTVAIVLYVLGACLAHLYVRELAALGKPSTRAQHRNAVVLWPLVVSGAVILGIVKGLRS